MSIFSFHSRPSYVYTKPPLGKYEQKNVLALDKKSKKLYNMHQVFGRFYANATQESVIIFPILSLQEEGGGSTNDGQSAGAELSGTSGRGRSRLGGGRRLGDDRGVQAAAGLGNRRRNDDRCGDLGRDRGGLLRNLGNIRRLLRDGGRLLGDGGRLLRDRGRLLRDLGDRSRLGGLGFGGDDNGLGGSAGSNSGGGDFVIGAVGGGEGLGLGNTIRLADGGDGLSDGLANSGGLRRLRSVGLIRAVGGGESLGLRDTIRLADGGDGLGDGLVDGGGLRRLRSVGLADGADGGVQGNSLSDNMTISRAVGDGLGAVGDSVDVGSVNGRGGHGHRGCAGSRVGPVEAGGHHGSRLGRVAPVRVAVEVEAMGSSAAGQSQGGRGNLEHGIHCDSERGILPS